MRQKVSASSHFLFVGEMFCWYQLSVLSILIFYMPRAAYVEAGTIETTNNCDLCLHVTRTGNTVRTVLLFHNYYNCIGEIIGTCTHNLTVYKICKPVSDIPPLCFNPEMETKWEFELRAVSPWGIKWGERGKLLGPLINRTVRAKPGAPVTLYFDACAAINSANEANKLYPPIGGEAKFPLVGCGGLEWERDYSNNEKYMCPWKGDWCSGIGEFGCVSWSCVGQATWQKGSSLERLKPPPSCTLGTCNPVTFNIPDPQDPEWEEGKDFGLRIDGPGLDPGTVVHIKRRTYTPAISSLQIFHSSYTEMIQPLPQIPSVSQNLFIGLAESIAYSLNITSCYVCGGTLVGDQWPWEAKEWDPSDQKVLQLETHDKNIQPSIKGSNPWVLKTNIIGRRCLTRKGERFQDQVGDLTCLGQRFFNEAKGRTEWWGKETEVNPLVQFPDLRPAWRNVTASVHWAAPKGLYWICGNRAYTQLPANWTGSCILGTIKPSFFLLPLYQGELLGYPTYAHFGEKRSLTRGNWEDGGWTPERITQYYGPATWTEDGVWGYRTSIYMLNRIIRLQAVLEITANETAYALNLLADQQTKIQNAVYQNRLALDYLLAKEGGVCGKFNLTNCCLQIDDQGRVIKEITERIPELSLERVQSQKGWSPGEVFERWFSMFGGFKAMVGGFVAVVGICLIILCLFPVARRVMKSMIETTVDQKITSRILWGKGYQSMDDYVNMDICQTEHSGHS
uniref:Envelope glycoprotein n=1 Tax=Hydrochoerus hydrochaeris TaxID=10149 RepID=G3KGU5_HYDHY|nr:envelope glycoprotein [Hydrochoerus hydrochaeris]